jgi:hypothetical protein
MSEHERDREHVGRSVGARRMDLDYEEHQRPGENDFPAAHGQNLDDNIRSGMEAMRERRRHAAGESVGERLDKEHPLAAEVDQNESEAANLTILFGTPDAENPAWQKIAAKRGEADEMRRYNGQPRDDRSYQDKLGDELDSVPPEKLRDAITDFDSAIELGQQQANSLQAQGEFPEAAKIRSATNEMIDLRNAMAEKVDPGHQTYHPLPESTPENVACPVPGAVDPEDALRYGIEQLDAARELNSQGEFEQAWNARRVGEEAVGYAHKAHH